MEQKQSLRWNHINLDFILSRLMYCMKKNRIVPQSTVASWKRVCPLLHSWPDVGKTKTRKRSLSVFSQTELRGRNLLQVVCVLFCFIPALYLVFLSVHHFRCSINCRNQFKKCHFSSLQHYCLIAVLVGLSTWSIHWKRIWSGIGPLLIATTSASWIACLWNQNLV